MKNKLNSFSEIEKECVYKTYQDAKCVNEKNKFFRLIGSCQEEKCPLAGNSTNINPNGCIELVSKVTIAKSKN